MRSLRISGGIWLAVFCCLAGRAAIGGTLQVPLLLNYQGWLTDGGGNPLASGATPFLFRVTDANGQPLYEETQTVEVQHGVAAAMIGNGTEPQSGVAQGGLPPEIFTPESPRFLEIWVNNELVDTPLEIVSVPYAYWSAHALHVANGAVDSQALATGSVTLQHFAEPVVGELATALLQTPAFQTLGSADGTAKAVTVEGNFAYSGASTLQDVLHDLDHAIKAREEKNLNKTGDTVSGPLTFVAETGAETLTLDAQTGAVSAAEGKFAVAAGGAINNTGGVATDGNLTATGGLSLASGKTSVDPITGTLTMTAGARLTGLPPAQSDTDAASWLDVKSTKTAIVGADGVLNFADVQDHLPLSQLQIATFAAWDQDVGNDVTTTTAFGGDLGGTFSNLQLGGGVVGTAELADSSVGTTKLAGGAITAAKLADGAVGAAALVAGAVTAPALAAGAVGSAALAPGAVGTVVLADGAVTAPKLAAGAVSGTALASGSVTGTTIADNTVSSADIVDGTIGTNDLGSSVVTSAKVSDGSLTGTDIADGSIGSADIADGTITNSDIQNSTIHGGKVIDESLTGFDITDGTITGADIADASITGVDIFTSVITGSHILNNSVTGADVADGSLGKEDLNFNVATMDDIADTNQALPPTQGIAKAWIKVGLQSNGSYEIHSQYNAASVTYVTNLVDTKFGKAEFQINWTTPFANANYTVVVTSEEGGKQTEVSATFVRYLLDANYIAIPVDIMGNSVRWFHVVAFGS